MQREKNAKGGGDLFMVVKGTGREGGHSLRCRCVEEEMSVDHGYFPNVDLICLPIKESPASHSPGSS